MEELIKQICKICRFCRSPLSADFKHKVSSYVNEINLIYSSEKIDIRNDDPNCQSKYMCGTCYKNVKKCQGEIKHKKKNPNSKKEFTYNMPDYNENKHLFTQDTQHQEDTEADDSQSQAASPGAAVLRPAVAPRVIAAGSRSSADDPDQAEVPRQGASRSLADRFVTPRKKSSVAGSPHVDADSFVTPSKVRKTSAEQESPSDKLSYREIRKQTPVRKSVKIQLEKVETDFETGENVQVFTKVVKVYTSQDSLPIDRVDNPELAKFFKCRLCGNYPRNAKVSITCAHIYCKVCIENYKEQVDSSKCPPDHIAIDEVEQEDEEVGTCRIPSTVDDIINIAGLLQEIHETIKFTCRNQYCDKEFNVKEICEHEKNCKVRGFYSQDRGSISSTRNQLLKKESSKTMNMILKWCKDFNISPCDFLFFTLKRLISTEAPELEDSVEEVFKAFLEKSKIDKDLLTAVEGLAIKIDADLSNSQYQKLRTNKVFGDKLPSLGRVIKEKEKLDPGNVNYKVYSLATGEVLEVHEAKPNTGIIDVDDELGNMTFGDLNINVHGCRSTLHTTIAKLVEEKYPDIEAEIMKNPDSKDILSDINRKITVFAKVCFDGTSAPVTSSKGASRLSVNSWLRGTVGIVGIEIVYHSSNEKTGQVQAVGVGDADVQDRLDDPEVGGDTGTAQMRQEEEQVEEAPNQERDEATRDIYDFTAQDLAQMNIETLSLLMNAVPDNLINMSVRDIVSRARK